MSLEEDWEKKLSKLGMPQELPTEQEKAAEADLDLVPEEMADPEAEALALKLKAEDPRNVFSGFPNSTENLVSLVETVKEEWESKGMAPDKIRLVLHPSCINNKDCVALSVNGEQIYHYNLKNLRGYSREKLVAALKAKGLTLVEK